MSQKYKYECRPCPSHIRRRCIQEAQMSPGVKRIIERAFESHTDTQATWDLLHRNCLLELRDRMVVGQEEAEHQHGLMGRIRRHEEPPQEQPAQQSKPPPVVRPPSRIEPGWQPNWEAELRAAREEQGESPPEPAPHLRPETSQPETASSRPPQTPSLREHIARRKPQTPSMLEHLAQFAPERKTEEIPELELERQPETAPVQAPEAPPTPSPVPAPTVSAPTVTLCYPTVTRPEAMPMLARGPRMLVAEATGHRIRLPEEGELVLGRFDPLTRVTPDVDLTFEDRIDRGVSRRHCQIGGWRGQYEIKDLGSSNGTWVNGTRLQIQETRFLEVGDEIRLGTCRLFFDRTPLIWQSLPPEKQYFLYVTFTGQYLPLPDQNTILLGRLDPSLGYTPDIDLSYTGDVAFVVSRRHAKLVRREDDFVVEDLGSAFKTRIDSKVVPVGIQVAIKPGQHLCLGGCILAFDLVEA